MKKHGERAHSKFSASGAERWFNCPGSVALSEGLPDKDTEWSKEGTLAHEVLEATMRIELGGNDGADIAEHGHVFNKKPREMIQHGRNAADFIIGLYERTPGSDIEVETRIYLSFIHTEMFGTYDGAVIEHFGTLHVFDYKYGAGHSVSPKGNLQMIFYAIGVAEKYGWNFKRVRLWIIQPRIKGYDGPTFWEISILELKAYVPQFRAAVKRVLNEPNTFNEGGHCHWCKAKGKCPLKQAGRVDKAIAAFQAAPTQTGEINYGEEKGHKEKVKKESKSSEQKELEAWYKRRAKKEKSKGKKKAEADFF